MGIFLPHYTCRHMHTRSSPSVTERGRVTVPCKDWPSATASGGCGLDKGLPPGPRLPPRDRRWSPAGDEHRGRSNDRAGRTAIAISNRWFSVNFSLALTDPNATLPQLAQRIAQEGRIRDLLMYRAQGRHQELRRRARSLLAGKHSKRVAGAHLDQRQVGMRHHLDEIVRKPGGLGVDGRPSIPGWSLARP